MTLTSTGLFNAMKTKLGTAQDAAMQEAALKPICEAIIEYITANGVINVNVSSLGLISGAAGTPVTGASTGTGTIS
jgi:hypothetical protein